MGLFNTYRPPNLPLTGAEQVMLTQEQNGVTQTVTGTVADILGSEGGPATVQSFNGRVGAVELENSDVTDALGYNPAVKSLLGKLSAAASIAIYNNPILNTAMTSPPTIRIIVQWAAATGYAAGSYSGVLALGTGSGGKGAILLNIYQCTTTGTSGSVGPTGTGTGIADGSVVWSFVKSQTSNQYNSQNSDNNPCYLWDNGTGAAGLNGVVTFVGGIPTGTLVCQMNSTTVGGALYPTLYGKIAFASDSKSILIRTQNYVANDFQLRVIVNGQYATLSSITNPNIGLQWFDIEFSTQVMRQIVVEPASQNFGFAGIDVQSTELVTNYRNQFPLNIVSQGDSLVGAGTDDPGNGTLGKANDMRSWWNILCNYLGVPNISTTAIGGTGYLENGGTQTTAIQRISDVTNIVNFFPNSIAFDCNGFDDIDYTPAQIQAACLEWMQLFRAAVGPNVPLFELGISPQSHGGKNWAVGLAMEAAKKAAVAQMNDPLIFFIPLINAPTPLFTGTGTDTTHVGDGNADIYMSGTNQPHSNVLGHAWQSQYVLNWMANNILGGQYA